MLVLDTLTKRQKYEHIATLHKDTLAEATFKQLLIKNKISYEQEVIKGKHRIDFIIDNKGYEIIGGYHNTLTQRKKDKTRANYLLKHFNLEIKELTNQQVIDCLNNKITLQSLLEFDTRPIKDKIISKNYKSILSQSEAYKKSQDIRRQKQKELYQKKKVYQKNLNNIKK